MVHGFVTSSHGAIRAENRRGGGATFAIYLPLAAPMHADPQPADIAKDATDDSISGVVLLIEDNPDVRRVSRRQLVDLGAQVIEAETAEEAEELLASVKGIRAVLCDVALPGPMSGTDLCRKIRVQNPMLPFVMMTGHGAGNVALDPVPVLQKPVSNDALRAALQSVLGAERTVTRR